MTRNDEVTLRVTRDEADVIERVVRREYDRVADRLSTAKGLGTETRRLDERYMTRLDRIVSRVMAARSAA